MWSRFKFFSAENILIAVALLAVFLFSLNQISESDTGFLVKTGEYVLQNKTVPLYDIFSYTAPGARWVAHYWLTGIFIYLAQLLFGMGGIIFFVAIVSVLTFFFVLKTAIGRMSIPLFTVPLLFLFFCLTFDLWSARPQIISYLFTAFLLFLLERFRKIKSRKILYFLPFLILIWANFHAGVVLGLVLIWLFVFSELIQKKMKIDAETRISFSVAAISTAASFLNPNGYLTLIYSSLIAPVAKTLKVMEWFSLLERLNTWQAKSFLGFMVLVVVFLIWRFWVKFKQEKIINWFSIFLVLAAVALPISSIRHVIFFPLIIFPVFAGELGSFLKSRKISLEFHSRYYFPILAALISIVVVAAGFIKIQREFAGGPINRKFLPVGAVDFIEREGIRGPFFGLEHGSYLIWRLWPKEKVFMDGRNEVYIGKPVQEYLDIVLQKNNWVSLVNDKYKINAFILFYRAPLDLVANNLTVRLMNELGFKLVYWDDAAIVLVRNSSLNQKVINNLTYEVINPFRQPETIKPELLKKGAAEAGKAINVAPDSLILNDYARRLLGRVK